MKPGSLLKVEQFYLKKQKVCKMVDIKRRSNHNFVPNKCLFELAKCISNDQAFENLFDKFRKKRKKWKSKYSDNSENKNYIRAIYNKIKDLINVSIKSIGEIIIV